MAVKLASIEQRGASFIISTSHRTTGGQWIAPDAPVIVDDDASDEALGWRVRAALDASQSGVPTPGPDVDVSKALQAAVGVTGYAAYMRGARSVMLRATDLDDGTETIDVTPQRNGGARSGFTPIDDQEETLTYESALALGEAVRLALSKAL